MVDFPIHKAQEYVLFYVSYPNDFSSMEINASWIGNKVEYQSLSLQALYW